VGSSEQICTWRQKQNNVVFTEKPIEKPTCMMYHTLSIDTSIPDGFEMAAPIEGATSSSNALLASRFIY
jgi:hypothetical protein